MFRNSSPQHASARQHTHRQSSSRAPKRGVSRLNPALFVKKAELQVKEEIYKPSFYYSEMEVHPVLKQNILRKGYGAPTPIQDQTIPHIMLGKDVLGIANTGTGKTAAFLIPLIHKVVADPKMRVLILTPTRELATQIQDEFLAFARDLRLWSVVCVGGLSIGRQIGDLRRNPQFLIATPGRLMDLKDRNAINLAQYTHLVLDEADRMVDMGFIKHVRMILAAMPKERQSLFFSATLPTEVKALIHSFLKEPITVSVKKQDTAANVDQDIIKIGRDGNKTDVLFNLLKQNTVFTKVLVFSRTKRGVDRIERSLKDKGYAVVSIHGDKPQAKRQKALDLFKENRAKILVATDVAARGLDIPNVTHVINFDAPESYEDYVHRIGRTGRADKKGIAITFVE